MSLKIITNGLKDYDKVQVKVFADYCQYLLTAIDRSGKLKYPWMSKRKDDYLISCFKKVAADGLVFDGENITLLNTGISYNYQAYKNKMLLTYPASIIDLDLVYSTDVFEFEKHSGKVIYTHNIVNPFNRTDENVIGGYCVIKNKRGEFLTLLSKADIDKHRKVAKTDMIWKSWFVEMAKKTVIKKACKQHFNDIYQNITNLDNENSDIENPLDISLSVKNEIENTNSVEELKKYFNGNKEKHKADAKGFNYLVNKRKIELEDKNDS